MGYGFNRFTTIKSGGISPNDMITFSVKNSYDSSTKVISAILTCQIPDDTVYNGQTICKVEGAIIVKKEGEYPTSRNDGEIIARITNHDVTEITDSGLTEGTTYYYQAFPYSDSKLYNTNETNRVELTAKTIVPSFIYNNKDYASDPSSFNVVLTSVVNPINITFTDIVSFTTQTKVGYGHNVYVYDESDNLIKTYTPEYEVVTVDCSAVKSGRVTIARNSQYAISNLYLGSLTTA